MTSAERERLRAAVDEARRAGIRFAPNAGSGRHSLARQKTPEARERHLAQMRAWKARAQAIIEELDEVWKAP
jgi:hypothetical protein